MINSAYKNAIQFTKSHYENFPVISLFIPKNLRKHVAVVYQFARQADDIADEGEYTSDERLQKLRAYMHQLNESLSHKFNSSFWHALNNTIEEKKISSQYFFNLLNAFEQDITKKRYANYSELTDYCSNSANSVGRIILELFGVFDESANKYSDAICTGLQLTNFYQDIKIDYQEKGRIYLPQDEMMEFGVDEKLFEMNVCDKKLKEIIKFQIERTRKLFTEGKKLFEKLPKSLKRQITLTVNGGEAILDKIEKLNYNVLKTRPILSKIDYFRIVIKSFR